MKPASEWWNLRPEELNWIAEGTELEGRVEVRSPTRFSGKIKGELNAHEGVPLVLDESSFVEGSVTASLLVIKGAVEGDVIAKEELFVARTARILGKVRCKSIHMEAGALLEGTLEQWT